MKRSQALSLLTLTLAGLPTGLLAQTPTTPTTPTTTSTGGGNVTVQLTFIGDESYNSMRGDDISQEECESGEKLTFDLSMMPTGPEAPGKLLVMMGDSCNEASGRDDDAKDCREVYRDDHDTNKSQYSVYIDIADVCMTEGDSNLYFLFVPSYDYSEDVQWYGVAEIPIDTEAPEPPKNVEGGKGETAIPVTWEDGSGNPTNYWVMWEPLADSNEDGGGAAEGECTSSRLVPGMPFDPEADMEGIESDETEGKVSEYLLSKDDIGTDRAVVAVIAEDLAGNRSVLSDTACVYVVESDGFWDAYQDDGGKVQPGCACSVPSKTGSTWSALPLALALFGLQLRRIRRRRS